MKLKIISINKNNIDKYKPICFLNTKSDVYKIKREWIEKRFNDGIGISILYDEDQEKIHGMIEYLPGEKAWRAVDAKNYVFIQCLWIYPNKLKSKGYGSLLIEDCLKNAKNKNGVAVITSDDSFMANKDIFIKNKFKIIAEDRKQQLLCRVNKKGALPKFKDYKKHLKKYKGWHLVYSDQCPWVSRFVLELDKKIIKKLSLKITELKTAKQAQGAPLIYSSLSLIYNGELLADHYISNTRFMNIIKKYEKK